MSGRCSNLLIVCAGALVYTPGCAAPLLAQRGGTAVTVHEWGTFTTVADENGDAREWLPLGGHADLPCFVQRYQNNPLIKLGRGAQPLDYEAARSSLRGRVRMETPVLYFYAPQQTAVSVRVQFPRGLMTEWYPHATVTQGVVTRDILRHPGQVSVIEWPHVTIMPGTRQAFPVDVASSHYYAARATDAAPLVVNGQAEKFLFYRGVADFAVPLSAELLPGGGVRIRNNGSGELRGVILFENRNGALGYRVVGALRTHVEVAAPSLDASIAGMRAELAWLLVSAGLYPQEADAMLNTWRDAWFEEGTRVFYILPRATIESILPLTISPAPAHIARVFVGRMDLVTPAAQRAVERAIAADDRTVLERYGRLLGAITDRVLARSTNSAQQVRIRNVRNTAFSRYASRALNCP